MVTRKPIAPRVRVRNVVLDTSASDFGERTAALAREVLSEGPVSAISCVGVGSGSMRWSEEDLKRLEVGVVGAPAQRMPSGRHRSVLPALRRWKHRKQPFPLRARMGMKEDTVRSNGFTRLAIFRPGIIVGNAHTPAYAGWFGSLIPSKFGNINQQILGRSIAAEVALHSNALGEVILENRAMKSLAAKLPQHNS
jgi:hypothetical protein